MSAYSRGGHLSGRPLNEVRVLNDSHLGWEKKQCLDAISGIDIDHYCLGRNCDKIGMIGKCTRLV